MKSDLSSNPFDSKESPGAPGGIDWRRAIHIVQRYFWIVLIFAVAGIVLAYMVTKRQTPLYRTQSTIVISSQLPSYLGSQLKSNLSDISDDYWYEKRYLETQYQIIRSEKIATLSARALKPKQLFELIGRPHIKGKEPNKEELQLAANLMRGAIQVSPRTESRIVDIIAIHTVPRLAKLIANTVAESYIEENLKRRLSSTKSASTWLDRQLKNLREKLDASEKRLYQFKIDNNIQDVSLEQKMKSLSGVIHSRLNQVEKFSTTLLTIESRLKQFRSLRRKNPEKDASADFVHSEAISELRSRFYSSKQKLSVLKVDLLERNPQVLKQEKVVTLTKKNLSNELRLMEQSLNANYRVAVSNLARVQRRLEKAQHAAQQLGKTEIEYKKLKRERDETEKLYELVLARLKETGLVEELKTNNIRMLDPARTPKIPFKPVLVLNLALGLALGLFLGTCIMILLYYLDNTLKGTDEVEIYLHSSLLGHIPLMPHHKLNTPEYDLFIFNHPQSTIAEAVRSIRTNILFMSPDRRLKTLVLTSAAPLEGKTTLTSYLSISMAMGGERTLIVDADMRKPRIHKVFSMKPKHGFSSLIVGKSTYEEAIVETQVPNLFVLPCGPIPPNPAELQQSSHFDKVFEELLNRFDRIIFDSPPVGLVADPAIIGQKADGVIVVTRYGQTTRHMLKNAYNILSKVKVNILGGIMNYVDEKRWGQKRYYYKGKRGKYGNYYQSRYGHYGYEEGEELEGIQEPGEERPGKKKKNPRGKKG